MYIYIDAQVFSKRLNMYMKRDRISVEEIQKMCYLASSRSVYYWLHGEKLPTLDQACTLAAFFGVSVEELLGLTDTSFMKYSEAYAESMISVTSQMAIHSPRLREVYWKHLRRLMNLSEPGDENHNLEK